LTDTTGWCCPNSKQAKLQWLQDPSQISTHNHNDVRHENSIEISETKEGIFKK